MNCTAAWNDWCTPAVIIRDTQTKIKDADLVGLLLGPGDAFFFNSRNNQPVSSLARTYSPMGTK